MENKIEKEEEGSLFLKIIESFSSKPNIVSVSKQDTVQEIKKIENEALSELEVLEKEREEVVNRARLLLEKRKVEDIKKELKKHE